MEICSEPVSGGFNPADDARAVPTLGRLPVLECPAPSHLAPADPLRPAARPMHHHRRSSVRRPRTPVYGERNLTSLPGGQHRRPLPCPPRGLFLHRGNARLCEPPCHTSSRMSSPLR